ncbi:MAG: PD-(D/E)XK nuclease family protein [Pseudomonadota bacterium]
MTESETAAWTGNDGAAAMRTLDSAIEMMSLLPSDETVSLSDIFEILALGTTVPEDTPGHPRLAIWGPLEARLQTADQFILAGLNEDVWPDRPSADGFLPRRFRAPLNLPPPEALLGLASHDFAGLATAADVTLVHSARREDAPAIASRWLLRLQTLVQGALGDDTLAELSPQEGRDPRRWIKLLDSSLKDADPMRTMPRPTPQTSDRPKQLSITRINTLQRDPYSIYAESVLGLSKLRPIDEPLGASARGTAIHAAIEAFGDLPPADQTLVGITKLVETELITAGQPEHLILAEQASLSVALEQFVAWWQARVGNVKRSLAESRGKLTIEIDGEPFVLTGIADRIEQLTDGTFSIIDFKTGAPPTKKAINAGFEQQLPLLNLILKTGEFEGVGSGTASQLSYVGVRFKFEDTSIGGSVDDVNALTDDASEILQKLISAYRDPSVPYLSVPRIQLKSAYEGDFDRLARRGEWAGELEDG